MQEVGFSGEMDRIMYLVKSNVFHIYKLMGWHSLKWSMITNNKDTGIVNACFLKTEVQCAAESRGCWCIEDYSTQEYWTSEKAYGFEVKQPSQHAPGDVMCYMRRHLTFGGWGEICVKSIKSGICFHTKCSMKRHHGWIKISIRNNEH